jgi:hypothetical protein
MSAGSRWVYRATDGKGSVQRVDVTVTTQRKVVDGIEAVVVHDLVTEDGEMVEDTLDWYAQDKDGNVWYLGEDTKEYEDGKVVSTEGSWEAGVDGAKAGTSSRRSLSRGLTYREEHYAGQAEDAAEVLSVEGRAEVPFGRFSGALITRNYTPLDPNVVELKLYARGIGSVLVVQTSGGSSREELVSFRND